MRILSIVLSVVALLAGQPVQARMVKVRLHFAYIELNRHTVRSKHRPTIHDAASGAPEKLPLGRSVTLVKYQADDGSWKPWKKTRRTWHVTDMTNVAAKREKAKKHAKKRHIAWHPHVPGVPILDVYVYRRDNPMRSVSDKICLVRLSG